MLWSHNKYIIDQTPKQRRRGILYILSF